jgi:geranylgeranyl pyrophosphate synthase
MSSTAPILSLEEFRAQFAAAFEDILNEQIDQAARLDPLFAELVQTTAQVMLRSGKRLRPYLMYLAYLGQGGQKITEIIRLSAAQELVHNAWLIHDDLIDRDLIRHGGPNVAGTYEAKFKHARLADAPHLAGAMALLAGNYNVALANHLILGSSFPAPAKIAAAQRLQAVILTEVGGEMLDVLMPTLDLGAVTPGRLLTIYRYKTAAYSFELPMQVGALLAGSAADLSAVSAFALPLGIAFQIADDLLGTFGNEQQLGKPVLSDLREGKRTILLLTGLRLATPEQRGRITASLGHPKAGYRHLAEVRGILEQCGARAETESLAQSYLEQSQAALKRLNYPSTVTTALHQLADYVVARSI